jgi:hypothetical protein
MVPIGMRRQRHRVARLDVDLGAGLDRVALGQPLRRQDVGLLAIGIVDQGDEGGAVGIVFDPLHRALHVPFPTLEIDDPVELLRAAADPPRGDPAGVVAAARLGEALGQLLDRAALPKLGTVDQNQPALARRRRIVCFQRHLAVFRLALSALERGRNQVSARRARLSFVGLRGLSSHRSRSRPRG